MKRAAVIGTGTEMVGEGNSTFLPAYVVLNTADYSFAEALLLGPAEHDYTPI